MRRVWLVLALFAAPAFSQPTLSTLFKSRASATIEDLQMELPPGWSLHQDVIDQGRLILGFVKGDEWVNLYVQRDSFGDLKSALSDEAKMVKAPWVEARGDFSWQLLTHSRMLPEAVGGGNLYVTSFTMDYKGRHYYGYARAATEARSKDAAYAFLDRLQVKSEGGVSARSLTGADYTGKKYYFGWGAAAAGDPSLMQNEVKYDVLHTHDIFTKEIGGSYIGKTLIGYANAKRTPIVDYWKSLGEKMTWNDMYVQYSSGHGSSTGLAVGVNYNEIRDNALSYPAKEIIIFTMACESGNLVNSFNAKKALWEKFQDTGRTLMVMASSKAAENSSTGPNTDPEEPGGPTGSAGSAFGHSLWKALIGHADGFIDGVKDGYLSLGEIEKFTIKKTIEVGDHTPVVTGAYQGGLIMNRVPSKAFLDSIEGSSEGLSPEVLRQRIEELDRAWRL